MASEKQKAAEKVALDELGKMGFTEEALLRALVEMFLAGVAWRDKHPQKRKGGRQA